MRKNTHDMVELKKGGFKYPDPKTAILSGGLDAMQWDEYLSLFDVETQARIKIIREYVEDNDLVGVSGSEMNDSYFQFEDEVIIAFTWRAWGDFMSALVGKGEDYMSYYSIDRYTIR